MASLTVAVIAHNQDVTDIIEQAESQTLQPDEILVFYSGTKPDTKYKTIKRPDKQDWGHDKRRSAIELASSDYVTFWNADDEYHEDFIIDLMSETPEADLVYCDFKSHLFNNSKVDSHPKFGAITSGSFIVSTELARAVGYNHDKYEADGLFIEDIMKRQPKTAKVRKTLYVHR